MKMKLVMAVAVTVAASVCSAWATTEGDLQDTWINAFPTNHADDMVGRVTWVSVTFSTNRIVSWTWEREGKTEAHSGNYSLHPEPGERGEFGRNTTVVIVPTTLAVRRPIVLKDVEVDLDNRFPVQWTVLKCKDIGDNRMVFLREKNQKDWRTTGGTVRR
jgi:hypothetical protein